MSADAPIFDIRPDRPRWTHIALRVSDIDASIAWYEAYTPLELLDRRSDDDGFGAWLGHPDAADRPFILVLAQFLAGHDPYAGTPYDALQPFAHLGIELPTRGAVDDIAARGAAGGCLTFPATQMPPPIGYICMLSDPDGNRVEYSFDQGVYATAKAVWGERGDDGDG